MKNLKFLKPLLILSIVSATALSCPAQKFVVSGSTGATKGTHSLFDVNTLRFFPLNSDAATITMIAIVTGGGDRWYLSLDEEPVVNATSSNISIECGELTIDLPFYNSFEIIPYDPSGIETVSTPTDGILYNISGQIITIDNLTPGADVSLYSVNGMTLWSGKADSNGQIEIDLSAYPTPLILSAAGQTLKFAK